MSLELFADLRQKQKKLFALFDALPTETIYGLVGANGPSGGKMPPETHWSFNVRLIAWRIAGMPIRHDALSLTKAVSDEELRALQETIGAESIIAFRGKLCERSPFGDTRAQLLSLLVRPDDEELELLLAQFRKPLEIDDPVIGKLVFDKAAGCFEGMVTWLGKPIDITIAVDESGSPSDSLRTAKTLLASSGPWTIRASDFAATALLGLKNDNWLEEDSPVSREEFIARMRLKSISAYPDGAFEFWHDDGNLFQGHSIRVSGSLCGTLSDAEIAA